MESRMTQQPPLDERCLVRSVVVEHEMDFKILGHVAVDGVEELSKLDASVTSMILCDDLSALDVEGGKDRRGALADVVVGVAFDLAVAERQAGMASVQC